MAMTKLNGMNVEGTCIEVVWAKGRNQANQDCHLDEVDRAYNRGQEALESWKQKEVSYVRGYGYDFDPSYSPPSFYNPMSPPPASRGLAEQGPMGIRSPVGGQGMMSGWGFRKHPAEVLDDLCQKNGWGSPVYELQSPMVRDGSGAQQLFLYKITIPALGTRFPNPNPFTPIKLCSTVEEAKVFAAEYTLMQLALEYIGPPYPYTQPSYVTHPDPPSNRSCEKPWMDLRYMYIDPALQSLRQWIYMYNLYLIRAWTLNTCLNTARVRKFKHGNFKISLVRSARRN
ncbi:APOBEC1 complementation factor-like isoform X2 [Liolophura sinensis]|uniref:APOBEC1 complementation factor-like isoform X2 n=1 Tax=Liolophura sinensis TaxID=3198878 RepID=UPI003158DC4A